MIYTYELVKVTRDSKLVIKRFVDMIYVAMEELEDGTFLIETRSLDDVYTYLKVTEQGEILYEATTPSKVIIIPLADGLLISDGANEYIYKVNKMLIVIAV